LQAGARNDRRGLDELKIFLPAMLSLARQAGKQDDKSVSAFVVVAVVVLNKPLLYIQLLVR
jgi:hypothetical protein